MATAKLPDLLVGKEFEEFIAAFLQRAFFVERNIIDRQETEILELDIITTSYAAKAAPACNIIEVKGGDWGASDLFKIRGWLDYLSISSGGLIVTKTPDYIETFRAVAKGLNITLAEVPAMEKAAE